MPVGGPVFLGWPEPTAHPRPVICRYLLCARAVFNAQTKCMSDDDYFTNRQVPSPRPPGQQAKELKLARKGLL